MFPGWGRELAISGEIVIFFSKEEVLFESSSEGVMALCLAAVWRLDGGQEVANWLGRRLVLQPK